MSKSQLIILSDIFGINQESWMDEYRERLNSLFEISEYDSRVLAGISSHDQDEIHAEFVNGGIERAVKSLRQLDLAEVTILGFSIGGTIAWKFALDNPNVHTIHAVSATRLRNEDKKPTSKINLYFGELETNGPSKGWFNKLGINPAIFESETHECYKSVKPSREVCSKILLESN